MLYSWISDNSTTNQIYRKLKNYSTKDGTCVGIEVSGKVAKGRDRLHRTVPALCSSRDCDNEGGTGGSQRIVAALCLFRGGENDRRGQLRLGFTVFGQIQLF